MGRGLSGELPAVVGQVRDRIARWRESVPGRSRLPEEVWEEAVSLARVHGVSPIARALGVGYETLRRRVCRCGVGGRSSSWRSGGWIEIDPSELLGAGPGAGVEVEWVDVDGAKLVVRLARGEGLDVGGLAEAFWRRGA